jgi:hypothetical protein
MNPLRCCAWLLLVASCRTFPPEELPPHLSFCNVDADCSAFELDCCTSCNGGTLMAARADATLNDLAPYRRRCAIGQGCTDAGCLPPTPVCIDRTCSFAEVDGFTWSAPFPLSPGF